MSSPAPTPRFEAPSPSSRWAAAYLHADTAEEVEISVVIPVLDEADNIGPLIGEVRTALRDTVYEIVVVDDGSSDDTPLRLAALRTVHPELRVIRHRARCGQSSAVRTGVKAARAPWIATLDGDGQNDPADIPALLARVHAADAPPDLWMVAGYRRRREDGWLRRFSSRVANGLRARVLRDGTPDTGCGLKLFSRAVYLDLPFFDHMHRFLPALVQRQGGRVVSVEVNHRPRLRGRSKYGVGNRLWVGIVDLWGVMWLRRRCRLPVVEEETGNG